MTYVLRPLGDTEADWVKLHEPVPEPDRENPQQYGPASESSFHGFESLQGEDDLADPSGILLEANRELRIKLFIGEVVCL